MGARCATCDWEESVATAASPCPCCGEALENVVVAPRPHIAQPISTAVTAGSTLVTLVGLLGIFCGAPAVFVGVSASAHDPVAASIGASIVALVSLIVAVKARPRRVTAPQDAAASSVPGLPGPPAPPLSAEPGSAASSFGETTIGRVRLKGLPTKEP